MQKTPSLLFVGALLLATGAALGVGTVYVEHNTELHFKKGDPNQVVISSEGELFLARRVETLLAQIADEWIVNAIALNKQGDSYVATSGQGYIYRLTPDQKPRIIYGQADADQRHVFSLALDAQSRLLAGTGGAAGLLLRFDSNDNAQTLWSDEEIKYIWAIKVGPSGRIYLATGPTGKVITLDPDGGNPRVLYTAKAKNILALALDKQGILYAGGDTHGLVYRIDPGAKQTTIAYDTGHSEVSGLTFDEQGNLYVSTADASAARPGAKLILTSGDQSRSEAAVKKAQQDRGPKQITKPEEKPEAKKPKETNPTGDKPTGEKPTGDKPP